MQSKNTQNAKDSKIRVILLVGVLPGRRLEVFPKTVVKQGHGEILEMNLKKAASLRALEFVESGMLLGLGTGSTAAYFVDGLGEALRSGRLRDIRGVPTSVTTAQRAEALGIPLVSLSELARAASPPVLDLAVDGADEVDARLDLIKGLGKALLREKMVEIHARRFVVVADASKRVARLGQGPLPVEIVPFEVEMTVLWLQSLGCRAEWWHDDAGQPQRTDNGNFLARCWFTSEGQPGIADPASIARALADRPGVVEHGLFLGMATDLLLAGEDGVEWTERKP